MMRVLAGFVAGAVAQDASMHATEGVQMNLNDELKQAEYEEQEALEYQQRLHALKEQFDTMDLNKDGFLDNEEAHKMATNDEEVASINAFLDKADNDSDGKITVDEYSDFAEKLDQERFDEKMRTIDSEFAAADADQDGHISLTEVVKLVGDEVGEQDVKAFFMDADTDSNDAISYDEYVDYAFQTDEDHVEVEPEL